jgi:hypothetical protein
MRLALLPYTPALDTLTHSVVSMSVSRTKTSLQTPVSPGVRFDDSEWKATKRPSALM